MKKDILMSSKSVDIQYNFLCMFAMTAMTAFQTFTKLKPFYSLSVYLTLFMLFIVGSIFKIKEWEPKSRKYLWAFLTFSAVIVLSSEVLAIPFNYKEYFGEVLLYSIWPFFLIYAVNHCKQKHLRILIAFFLITINISSIFTLQGVLTNPDASRILAGQNDMLLKSLGIGGYGFIYGLVFLNYALWIGVRTAPNRFVRIYLLAAIVLNYFTILYSSYSTAILFSLILFVLANLQDDKNSKMKIILIAIVFLFAYFFRLQIFEALENLGKVLKLDWIENRMGQLADATKAGDYEDLKRFKLYQRSFKTFSEHPLLGKGEYAFIGGHSQVLDYMAKYGIWGLAFVYLNVAAFSVWNSFLKKNAHFFFMILYIVFIFINTCMSIEIPCFVFFVVPLLIYLFSKNKYDDSESGEDSNDMNNGKEN